MIDKLTLRSGQTGAVAPLQFPMSSVTIFVGPNNSGKSVVLREIELYLRNPEHGTRTLVFDSLELSALQEDEIKEACHKNAPKELTL